MEINCVFPPAVATPDHIALAEDLGYERAWVYDVPVSYADTGATLALAAQKTSTIRLGVSVLTPHLRHITANAGLVAYLSTVAFGRFDTGIGAGFSSSTYLGRKPSRWSYVEEYVRALQALLAGDTIEWEGATLSLMHSAASGIQLPIEATLWIAAHGPKGMAAAERLGAGVVSNPTHGDEPVPFSGERHLTYYGTVLDEGEPIDSRRVKSAAGPGASLALHMGEHGPLAGMPEAVGYHNAIAEFPEDRRHLEVFRGHLIEPNPTDCRFITADVIRRGTMTGTRQEVAGFLVDLERSGAGAVLYQPAGSDIPRELEKFHEVAKLRHEIVAQAIEPQSA